MVRGRGTGGRAAPSWETKFNSEMSTAPASSAAGYYFRWNDALEAFDLSSYNSDFSDHQINEQQIVTFFKDVHSISLRDPKKTNILHWINVLNLLGGLVAGGLFILLSYSQPTRSEYIINEYSKYKAVVELKNTSYLIYTPMVGMGHFLLGFMSWLFINLTRIQKMRLGRFTKRVQQIKEVFERHKATTFSGLNLSLEVGSLGAYVGLKFDWKRPQVMLPVGYAPNMAFNAPPPGFSLG